MDSVQICIKVAYFSQNLLFRSYRVVNLLMGETAHGSTALAIFIIQLMFTQIKGFESI